MTADLTRREAIRLATIALASGSIGCGERNTGVLPMPDGGVVAPDGDLPDAGATCLATGEQTAGPFYPGEPAPLADIIGDRTGVALMLRLEILAAGSCEPLSDVEVDLWSADSQGLYSGYEDFDTLGEDWLRGQQTTDAQGLVFVQTVVPGAYPGRAVHIHVKARALGKEELTTQIYFPDEMVAQILELPAYEGGVHTENSRDSFYAGDTLLTVSGSVAEGYEASVVLYV